MLVSQELLSLRIKPADDSTYPISAGFSFADFQFASKVGTTGLNIFYMKKLIYIALTAIFGNLSLFAQTPDRFLQTYNTLNYTNSESYGVVETSYGYMISGISIDTSGYQNGYYAYTLMGVDFNGNKLWEKKYGNQNLNFGVAWYAYDYLKSYKGYYYSITNAIDSTNYAFSMVFKLNEMRYIMDNKI